MPWATRKQNGRTKLKTKLKNWFPHHFVSSGEVIWFGEGTLACILRCVFAPLKEGFVRPSVHPSACPMSIHPSVTIKEIARETVHWAWINILAVTGRVYLAARGACRMPRGVTIQEILFWPRTYEELVLSWVIQRSAMSWQSLYLTCDGEHNFILSLSVVFFSFYQIAKTKKRKFYHKRYNVTDTGYNNAGGKQVASRFE